MQNIMFAVIALLVILVIYASVQFVKRCLGPFGKSRYCTERLTLHMRDGTTIRLVEPHPNVDLSLIYHDAKIRNHDPGRKSYLYEIKAEHAKKLIPDFGIIGLDQDGHPWALEVDQKGEPGMIWSVPSSKGLDTYLITLVDTKVRKDKSHKVFAFSV